MATKQTPTRTVLDGAPARVLTFLIGVNTSLEARSALMARGYTPEEHADAWALLGKLGNLPGNQGTIDRVVQKAVAEINAWDEPNFACIRSSLERSFPGQAEFVFANDLQPSPVGSEAVLAVTTMLDRLDALEAGTGRKGTKVEDKKALDLLATRGYPKEERERLRALTVTASTVETIEPMTTSEADTIKAELYGFLSEWTTIAKANVKRRDVLIRLGVAKRKKRGATAPEEPTPAKPDPKPPVVVAPPTPTPPAATPPVVATPAAPAVGDPAASTPNVDVAARIPG